MSQRLGHSNLSRGGHRAYTELSLALNRLRRGLFDIRMVPVREGEGTPALVAWLEDRRSLTEELSTQGVIMQPLPCTAIGGVDPPRRYSSIGPGGSLPLGGGMSGMKLESFEPSRMHASASSNPPSRIQRTRWGLIDVGRPMPPGLRGSPTLYVGSVENWPSLGDGATTRSTNSIPTTAGIP